MEYEYAGIEFDENPRDWIIGNNTVEIPENTNTTRYEYNQAGQRRTRNACGIYAPLGAISDLTGYKFTTEEILDCVNLAEAEYGWKEDSGMYMSKWVDCARNWWNAKFPEKKVYSLKFSLWDTYSLDALKKNHSLIVWYRTSREYYNDSQDDGVVTGENFPKWGGHLTRCEKWVHILDSYASVKKYNKYEIDTIFTLRKNWVYFPSAYLFLKYENMGKYETQYKNRYWEGTIYNDIEWAIESTGFDREQFFLLLIWMERAKGTL